MFIKLNRTDVHSITNDNGNDKPTGDVYINIKDISHIDGNFVVVGGYVFYCADTGIKKVLSAIEIADIPENDSEAELKRLFELADEREASREWFRENFCKECE